MVFEIQIIGYLILLVEAILKAILIGGIVVFICTYLFEKDKLIKWLNIESEDNKNESNN